MHENSRLTPHGQKEMAHNDYRGPKTGNRPLFTSNQVGKG